MAFVKNTMITLIAIVSSTILVTILSIIIARSLTPSGQGLYALVLLIPKIVMLFCGFGIPLSIVYFGAGKKFLWEDLADNSLVTALSSGSVAILIMLICYFADGQLFNDMGIITLAIVLISIPFQLILVFFSTILLGKNYIVEHNAALLSQTVIQFVFIMGVLLVVSLSLTSIVIAYTGSMVISALFTIALVKKTTKISLRFSPKVFLSTFRFALPSYIGSILQLFHYRISFIIMSFFVSTTMIGYYSITLLIGELVWYVPTAASKIIIARAPRTEAHILNQSTPKICRNTFVLSIVTGILLAVTGKFLIDTLYGASYQPAFGPLLLLLPGTVVLSIALLLANEIDGRGRPRINLGISAISLVVNTVLNLLLIPAYGINGAAMAATLSYCLNTALTLLIYSRMTGVRVRDIVLIKPGDLTYFTDTLLSFKNNTRNVVSLYLHKNVR